ncbi:hypothetical protein [Brevibacillus laterosporus]|uniref:hypothetical protein n=1 Tax=Brevibacillus laterosporus TaxID=1465 RepID=UPI000CE3E20F|nr:hypothetical protein [Brevibacillus laterosporus]AYB36998.1 hypothetical protein D5F52_01175 [Brevibacillus laterosporus]MBG9772764.1 hypothetical protein [Brevibacillus laterosporus]MBM7107410.1 hypothetical protein [Brevibacillus laterosporus]MCR8936736.1 hypothetical protein [Brevibacillus laterosporus]MCZ0839375.1 hypothetical protein [Brevibacillus laterosporus]
MKGMKLIALSTALLALGGTTVFAATQLVSPYGQEGNYQKVALTVDRSPINERGIVIEGKVYVPVEPLQNLRKLAYSQDDASFVTHLFFGGSGGSTTLTQEAQRVMGDKDVLNTLMQSIPYESKNYHSGMMLQDLQNIASLASQMKKTTDTLNKAIYSKLNQNVTPNVGMLKQTYTYATVPIEIMRDRMEALSDEMGDKLSKSDRRRMDDVIELLNDAVKYKQKSVRTFEDWLESSDEDDLEDMRDYEKDANKYIDEAIKYLNGFDAKKPGKKYSNNLRDSVLEWIRKTNK